MLYRETMKAQDEAQLPLIKRHVVRLAVLDADDRILLLHVQDLGNPQFGTAWELPGGGIEQGETYIQAAVRELREETGLEVPPECIGAPTWRRDVSYVYRGACRQQHEIVAVARLTEASPAVLGSHRFGVEKEDVLATRWWSVEQILTSGERFYPRSLPALLPRFLRGERIDEPLEQWP